MVEKWAVEVITRLRMLDITQKDFAKKCGYSAPYVCQVLRGRKNTYKAKETITRTLSLLEQEDART